MSDVWQRMQEIAYLECNGLVEISALSLGTTFEYVMFGYFISEPLEKQSETQLWRNIFYKCWAKPWKCSAYKTKLLLKFDEDTKVLRTLASACSCQKFEFLPCEVFAFVTCLKICQK